ncbi:MAG: phosphotransferase [Patescibacteria group bacterium]|nr:phosphotransferase [Patescibacteria group bacterium]
MDDKLEGFVSNLLNDEILKCVHVHGGLVHKVFRIYTKSGKKYILKQRLSHYSALPSLYVDYKKIFYEKRALEIMHNAGLEKYFPKLLGYSLRLNSILMEDVLDENSLVCDDIQLSRQICEKIINAISDVHLRTKNLKQSIHGDCDKRIYRLNIKYRILNHAKTLQLAKYAVKLLCKLKRNIILGDVCPKNIIINKSRTVFLDLEYCHRGNYEFEISYVLAHLIIQGVSGMNPSEVFEDFFEMYLNKINSKINYKMTLILCLSIMLYRLEKGAIPYKTNFTVDEKINLVSKIRNFLNQKKGSFDSKILLQIMYESKN